MNKSGESLASAPGTQTNGEESAQNIKPVATRVRDTASFWQFFNRLTDFNNAALRVELYGDSA